MKTATLPPIRIEPALLDLAKTASKSTGVPVAFVVRNALQDWVEGRYDPTHTRTSVILAAEARAEADVMRARGELEHAQWEEKNPEDAAALIRKAKRKPAERSLSRRGVRPKGDRSR